mgnify:CR=1 FL=1
MKAFTKRNILLYFRDKTAVFFSLLAVIIVILLYSLFLGDLTAKEMPDVAAADHLLSTWIIAGILAITSMTTTLGAFGILVEDQANRTILDFYASPISRTKLVMGYILSACLIGVTMCILILIGANVYLLLNGHGLLPWKNILTIIGIILLSVLASCSIVLWVVSYLKTANAFAAASMLIGTLIGFLAGVYIPIGNLPNYLQTIVILFPVSHGAALFRQVIMEPSIMSTFAQAPQGYEDAFLLTLGVKYELNGYAISNTWSVLYLIVVAIVFFGWALLRLRRKLS